ncbi:MAG: GT4 family glycosyltransferase PelF [Deltaproteobacteria bacterium]|nr:GT4 family glycosyltransferase PelF [Deltaproteobacteria bacterium]
MLSYDKYDLCLLVEGDYPYGRGGISTWIHNYLLHFGSQKRIAVVSITADLKKKAEVKWRVPENVDVYLCPLVHSKRKRSNQHMPAVQWQRLIKHDQSYLEALLALDQVEPATFQDFWKWLRRQYPYWSNNITFLTFYWITLLLSTILHKILSFDIPPASIYHATGCGYAGYMGVRAKYREPQAKLFVTEHGIYFRERFLEYLQINIDHEFENIAEQRFVKAFWLQHFNAITQISYKNTDELFSISAYNARIQKTLFPQKDSRIIYNNYTDKLFDCTHSALHSGEIRIAIAGRVTRIKNVRGFIRIIAYLAKRTDKNVRGLVLGDWDNNERYYEQCKILARQYQVDDHIEFKGFCDLKHEFKEVDALLITSYSEGLPYVILDAFANGVPVIAYDVGACREMLGFTDNAQCAETIFPPGSISDVAEYLLSLRDNPQKRRQLVSQGLEQLDNFFLQSAYQEYGRYIEAYN